MVSRRYAGVVAAGVLGSSLISGCHHHQRWRIPVDPAPEPAVFADIRGVVFEREAGGGQFRFSEVFNVRWTPAALEIDGRIDRPGSPNHGQREALSFPYEDVSHLLTESRPNKEDVWGVRIGSALGAALGAVVAWALVIGLTIGGMT